MERASKILGHLTASPCSSKEYKFTLSNRGLTDDQREFYEKNGFVVIKGLLNESEVSKYYNRFDELVADPKLRPPNMLVMRDVSLKGLALKQRTSDRVVTKLQNWSQERVLWDFAKHPKIIKTVEGILGSDIRAHHFMLINKPSDPGALSSRHPFHQDQWYFPFAPSRYIVCAWTALQRVHRGNGCLVVIPGTHKTAPDGSDGRLYPHSYPTPWTGPVNKAYHGIQLDDKGNETMNSLLRRRVHLEMEPGDTVFFHPLLIHGSGANLSPRNRRSISVHYANSKKVDFIRNGVIPEQARVAKEIEEVSKRMKGFTVSYDQIWKAKSRQVQGDVGSFKM